MVRYGYLSGLLGTNTFTDALQEIVARTQLTFLSRRFGRKRLSPGTYMGVSINEGSQSGWFINFTMGNPSING